MLDVERSLERSHLQALNIPASLTNAEIELGFRNLYPDMTRLVVNRSGGGKSASCKAVIEFPDHHTALEAKRWSGVGSVNLWNQNVKILWAQKDQIKGFVRDSNEVKHIVVHNVPEVCDPEEFGRMMHMYVSPIEIISIRPMKTDYVIEFASTHAAFSVLNAFNKKFIGANELSTEWQRNPTAFADFDFELRCICLANYWDPPIFIYGRIVPITSVQLVSVIIKNNRKNQFVTVLLEMNYDGLVDIHARVCEVLVLYLMESKELPKQNLIFKCSKEYALLVGVVNDLSLATVTPSTIIMNKSIYMYLEDLAALSKMSYTLIASEMLDEIYSEYKMILKEKNVFHQIICGINCDGNILGCIDPAYRMGKPLKYELDSRQMILALCDQVSMSNFYQKCMPVLECFPKQTAPKHFKIDKVQLIPLINAQRREVHYTFRPFIEYNQVDSFSRLKDISHALGLDKIVASLPDPSNELPQAFQVPAAFQVPPPAFQKKPSPFKKPPSPKPLLKPRLSVFEAFSPATGPAEGAANSSFDFNCFLGTLPK